MSFKQDGIEMHKCKTVDRFIELTDIHEIGNIHTILSKHSPKHASVKKLGTEEVFG